MASVQDHPFGRFDLTTLSIDGIEMGKIYYGRYAAAEMVSGQANRKHTAHHVGQFKLFMTELMFLLPLAKANPETDFKVVYAGAANGAHIPYLIDLLNNVAPGRFKFLLIDPAPFSENVWRSPYARSARRVATPDKDTVDYALRFIGQISILNMLLDDDLARRVGHHVPNSIFVSDIRVTPSEERIFADNEMQARWVELMMPLHSMLKFRTPYVIRSARATEIMPIGRCLDEINRAARQGEIAVVNTDEKPSNMKYLINFDALLVLIERNLIQFDDPALAGFIKRQCEEAAKGNEEHFLLPPHRYLPMPYLRGRMMAQLFAPPMSTELRLLIDKQDINNRALYNIVEIEARMAYYNWIRHNATFPESKFQTPNHPGVYQPDGCFDCYATDCVCRSLGFNDLGQFIHNFEIIVLKPTNRKFDSTIAKKGNQERVMRYGAITIRPLAELLAKGRKDAEFLQQAIPGLGIAKCTEIVNTIGLDNILNRFDTVSEALKKINGVGPRRLEQLSHIRPDARVRSSDPTSPTTRQNQATSPE